MVVSSPFLTLVRVSLIVLTTTCTAHFSCLLFPTLLSVILMYLVFMVHFGHQTLIFTIYEYCFMIVNCRHSISDWFCSEEIQLLLEKFQTKLKVGVVLNQYAQLCKLIWLLDNVYISYYSFILLNKKSTCITCCLRGLVFDELLSRKLLIQLIKVATKLTGIHTISKATQCNT